MDPVTPACDGQTTNGIAGRSIVLFSDGTGNSSAKLFKTNVWRMYEAVDLGPAAEGRRDQIAYYDDGVGTSAFKPLALLGGAFGWGLKRNVLDIYRFACRNYRDKDEIYGFGFSRGAFTMRVVIALIASQGLVTSNNEAELVRRSRDAYRAFRRDLVPRKFAWPTKAFRRMRDGLTRWIERRRGIPAYPQSDNLQPIIRFIGVWDTVAAYGGPIAEITRAIDNWFYPLSMPDYKLHESVQCARHALALDDERDAFHPLLWDEVHEATLVAAHNVPPQRLEQVWFTGMHSDVGGGYPDESLSFVSLLWMMEEAEEAGLRTLKPIKKRFVALASSAGPIHDSRQGLAAYYRYQPRKIVAWTDPVDPRTYGLRDPTITADDGRPQGLLRSVRVHESVVARIATGTDRYAPITLPRTFDIVPPQVEGENVPQADSEGGHDRSARPKSARPMTDARLRARLADDQVVATRDIALEAVWDLVWRRRVAYFVTVALTVLLVSMRLWVDHVSRPPLLADGRTWIGGVTRMISLFLPGVLEPWVNTFADNTCYFLILAVGIAAVMGYSSFCELALRDRARLIWRETTTVGGPDCHTAEPTRLQRLRNAPRYQRTMQMFKWRVLPDLVVAPLLALAGLWLVGGALTQAALPWLESGNSLCAPTADTIPELTVTRIDFSTRATCHTLGARVVRGQRYTVTFEVVNEWRDGGYSTAPVGLAAGGMSWGLGYLGVPFRRVIEANYLQPAIEIRQRPGLFRFSAVHIYPLDVVREGGTRVVYRAEFEARHDGELLLFANDGVLPFDRRYFYERSGGPAGGNGGNAGTACVTVQRAGIATADHRDSPSLVVCAEADRRAAAVEDRRNSQRQPGAGAVR